MRSSFSWYVEKAVVYVLCYCTLCRLYVVILYTITGCDLLQWISINVRLWRDGGGDYGSDGSEGTALVPCKLPVLVTCAEHCTHVISFLLTFCLLAVTQFLYSQFNLVFIIYELSSNDTGNKRLLSVRSCLWHIHYIIELIEFAAVVQQCCFLS